MTPFLLLQRTAAAAANADETLESGELLLSVAEFADLGMGSLVGAAVFGGPALVIGAGLGFVLYGGYELYEYEKGPPSGP